MTPKRNTQLDRPGVPPPVDPERHTRNCAICRSAHRQEIENAFLHWVSPHDIFDEYDLPSRMTVYSHAHATGLYEYRRRNLRSALDRLIEQADSASVSGDCVIRAIRAQSHLGDDGRWTDPVRHVIVSRRPDNFVLPAGDPQEVIHKTILFETQKGAETPVTDTKQTIEAVSIQDKNNPEFGIS
jgi:hypothetical protein